MTVKKLRQACLLIGVSTLLVAAPSYAIGVDVFGAGTYSMATGTPTPTANFSYPGGGVIFNFKLGSKVDFQLGAAYLTRTLAIGLNFNQTMVDGLAGIKFNFSRMFFLNIGGFYNYYVTDAIASTGSDYGVDAGLGIVIPLSNSVGILLNPRYHYSLATMTNVFGTYTPSEIIGFVGLSFGMSGK